MGDSEDDPVTHAPEKWLEQGFGPDVGYPGPFCKCSKCGIVRRASFMFDFYANNDHEELTCETCTIHKRTIH